jgi:ABC-type lipoprotein release transport system permease subunit
MNIISNSKKFRLFIKENISTATSLIGIIIGIVALYISILSYKNANDQFEKNSITSDSLFNVQLYNERQLNDSLIMQIRTLQKNNKQSIGNH